MMERMMIKEKLRKVKKAGKKENNEESDLPKKMRATEFAKRIATKLSR